METQGLPSFSDAIDAIGIGPFQSRLVLVCGFFWLSSEMGAVNVAFVIDDIADTFEMDALTKGLVGGTTFLGMIFGAILVSALADKSGRRIACFMSLACTVLAGFASALSSSVGMLLVCRTLVGFGIGGNIPVTNVFLAEFLPTNNRAAKLCQVIGIVSALSITLVSLLGFALSRALGSGRADDTWRSVLGLSVIPGAIGMVAIMLNFPESPRFLSLVGKHDEAVEVLEELARVNGVTNVLGMELSQLFADEERVGLQIEPASVVKTENEGQPTAGGLFELFQEPTVRKSTISMWAVWFFVQLSGCGMSFLLPKYFKAVTGDSDDGMYILGSLLGICYAPGAFLALWVCTEDRLGRVGTLKCFSWLTVAWMLAMAMSSNHIPLFLTLAMAAFSSSSVPLIVTFVITPELYYTKHRVVGLASSNVWARLGGILAPFSSEVLYAIGPLWPLAAFGSAMALVAVFAGLIPFETAGRQLDVENARFDERPTTMKKTDHFSVECERE